MVNVTLWLCYSGHCLR